VADAELERGDDPERAERQHQHEFRSRCLACGAPFSSAFAVECEECGGELRPNEQFGVPIRKD